MAIDIARHSLTQSTTPPVKSNTHFMLNLLVPGDSLGLKEFIISVDTTEPTESTALPSTVRKDGLVMDSQGVDVHSTIKRTYG